MPVRPGSTAHPGQAAMRRARRRILWRSALRRLSAGLVLFAYLGTAFGLPLPAREAKDQSQPYPCQNHPCGCQSAQQCWQHCCCFTPEEKWAWAEAHGVVPPAYAERPRGQGWCTPRLRDREESCGSCRACGKSGAVPGMKPSDEGAVRPRGVIGITALRCRGLSTWWVGTGIVLPPPHSAGRELPAPALDGVWDSATAAPHSPATPPDPPPRQPA
jgi:hypothetical protein